MTETNPPPPRPESGVSESPDPHPEEGGVRDFLRRRHVIKGLGAVPVVMTLRSGAALAQSSQLSCLSSTANAAPAPTAGCLPDSGAGEGARIEGADDFVRIQLDPNGKLPGGAAHPDYVAPNDPNADPNNNLCLVYLDSTGSDVTSSGSAAGVPVTASCWASLP